MKTPTTHHLVKLFTVFALLALPVLGQSGNPHFVAVYNNTFEIEKIDGSLVWHKVISGKGFNSAIGESTVLFVGTIDLSSAPFQISGTTTFTDTDGDELRATTTGTVTPASSDPTLVQLDYDYVFTGGTGKFESIKRGRAHVMGAAVFTEATDDAASGTASWCMEGSLLR